MIYVVLRPLLGENGTARQRVGVSNPVLVTGHVGLARPDAVGVVGENYDTTIGFTTTFSASNHAINNHSQLIDCGCCVLLFDNSLLPNRRF